MTFYRPVPEPLDVTEDAKSVEAQIRQLMAAFAGYQAEAIRGSYTARRERRQLMQELDALFDEHAFLVSGDS